MGHTNAQIAQEVGVAPATVSKILNSTLAQAEITALRRRVEDQIVDFAAALKLLSSKSIEILREVLHDPDQTHKTKDRKAMVAVQVLKGAGHLAGEREDERDKVKVGVQVIVNGVTAQEVMITAARRDARSAGALSENNNNGGEQDGAIHGDPLEAGS